MWAVFLNLGGGGNVRPSASSASMVASGIAPPSSPTARLRLSATNVTSLRRQTPTGGCRPPTASCPESNDHRQTRTSQNEPERGGNEMGAPVVWFEVAGRDFDTLSKFYTELFHWKVDADNPTGYGMVDTGGDGGIPGGVFAGGDTEYVSFYVQVPDLEARLRQAEKLGAKVVQPPTPTAPDGPTIAMVTDPEGHRIGILQEPS